MWGLKHKKQGPAAGLDRKKTREADMADAIRDVLANPDIDDKLRTLSHSGPFSELRVVMEATEMAALRAERIKDYQMSDAMVIQIAQRIVGVLNSIAVPGVELHVRAGSFHAARYDCGLKEIYLPDASGYNVAAYRNMALEVTQKPPPVSPQPQATRP